MIEVNIRVRFNPDKVDPTEDNPEWRDGIKAVVTRGLNEHYKLDEFEVSIDE